PFGDQRSAVSETLCVLCELCGRLVSSRLCACRAEALRDFLSVGRSSAVDRRLRGQSSFRARQSKELPNGASYRRIHALSRSSRRERSALITGGGSVISC